VWNRLAVTTLMQPPPLAAAGVDTAKH
jgi:hypothetical protein